MLRTKSGRLFTSQLDIGCDVRACLACTRLRGVGMLDLNPSIWSGHLQTMRKEICAT